MATRNAPGRVEKVNKLVKRVAADERRKNDCAALQAARDRVRARRRFIPKRTKPVGTIRPSF
jgi:hypothetical protein